MKFFKHFMPAVIMLISFTETSFAETINVKKFGATGDGKTDDTKAIQAAIDASSVSSSNIIFFPKGTYILKCYTITKNYLENYFLRIHSNITFQGTGVSSVIKLASHVFDKTDSNANAHLFYGIKVFNVQFTSLLINLNGANNLVPEFVIKNNCAIFINHGNNVTVKNVTVKNASGRNMIIILGNGKNVLVEKNKFLNGGNNVGTQTLNRYQPDFSFVYCEWDSTRIINNLIQQQNIDLALNAVSGGIELHGSYCYAAGNTITGCSPGVYISSSWHAMENTTVEKNQFLQCTRGISFWINYPMTNITISDNIIQLTQFRKWKNYTSSGIEMPNGNTVLYDSKHANGAAVNHLLITNNKISGPLIQTTTDRTAGMVLHSLQNSTISNNIITGMSFGGIILQGSKWGSESVKIIDNKFVDFKTNYDPVSPAGYITIFDSYIITDKKAPGLKDILVSNNDFARNNKPAVNNKLMSQKTGRFTGVYVALPEYLQKEIHLDNNHFSNKEEKVEYVKTY